MIIECPVLMTNDVVTVVRFNDINVQFPSIQEHKAHVRVACDNGKYFIVDDSYIEPNHTTDCSTKSKRRGSKKTTIEERAISGSPSNMPEDDSCSIIGSDDFSGSDEAI